MRSGFVTLSCRTGTLCFTMLKRLGSLSCGQFLIGAFLSWVHVFLPQNDLSGFDRPLWAEYPTDNQTFKLQESFLVGADILVAPVLEQDAETVAVYFPGDQHWHDLFDFAKYDSARTTRVKAPLNKIPVFQRGGSIVPRKLKPAQSTAAMSDDPFTLFVALDSQVARAADWSIDQAIVPLVSAFVRSLVQFSFFFFVGPTDECCRRLVHR
eukprot:m.145121 g.145121  ORF g.145121 m.145121 type:complete len:210 (+) comp52674_c0_seq9:2041-2670(+)